MHDKKNEKYVAASIGIFSNIFEYKRFWTEKRCLNLLLCPSISQYIIFIFNNHHHLHHILWKNMSAYPYIVPTSRSDLMLTNENHKRYVTMRISFCLLYIYICKLRLFFSHSLSNRCFLIELPWQGKPHRISLGTGLLWVRICAYSPISYVEFPNRTEKSYNYYHNFHVWRNCICADSSHAHFGLFSHIKSACIVGQK